MASNYIGNNFPGALPHPLIHAAGDGFIGWYDMVDPLDLLEYYRFGMFPWQNYGNKGAFFFPKKRFLIQPSKIKIPKSIRSYFNQGKFELSFDQAFREVILSCKYAKRKGDQGTWISNEFVGVYTQLHQMGYAHSVEVWKDDLLIGGLYGVAIGKVFTGESMFSLESNASRFALIGLAIYLSKLGFEYIDCQVKNSYLASFGGEEVNAKEFFTIMKNNYFAASIVGNWGDVIKKIDDTL